MDLILHLFLGLLSQLLFWGLTLLENFWFVILILAIFKMLGNQGKKGKQARQRKRNLTPVESGGFPAPAKPSPPQPQPRRVIASSRHEPIAPPVAEEVPEAIQLAARERNAAENAASARAKDSMQTETAPIRRKTDQTQFDPREGMKWALIFGPPRAKSPHVPPLARRNQ